jgi:hypothetical protein
MELNNDGVLSPGIPGLIFTMDLSESGAIVTKY